MVGVSLVLSVLISIKKEFSVFVFFDTFLIKILTQPVFRGVLGGRNKEHVCPYTPSFFLLSPPDLRIHLLFGGKKGKFGLSTRLYSFFLAKAANLSLLDDNSLLNYCDKERDDTFFEEKKKKWKISKKFVRL
jgi:hypothetical protein